MSFGNNALSYLSSLNPRLKVPKGVEILPQFSNPEAFHVNEVFYQTFFNDDNTRDLILGINPGRFGAGITGIAFTDPIRLETVLRIKNTFQKKPELSSVFVYEFIQKFGGPEKFYSKFFVNSVCPLGFTKDGKNLNYYDLPELEKLVTPFIINSLEKVIKLGINTNSVFCLGEGKNFKYLHKLNQRHQFFKQLIPLAHPRYIMQYKRKQIEHYLDMYCISLGS